MGAKQEIRKAQQDWARSEGISFNEQGYVDDVKSNLREPLSARARQGYEGGSGRELQRNMRALHSSSALVANFFDYWTYRDKPPLLSALGVDAGGAKRLDFEKQFDTPLSAKGRGNPPHLDIAIKLGSGHVVAIESKFTEWTSKKTKVDTDFRAKYLQDSPGLWERRGLSRCQEFAEMVGAGRGGNKSLFQFPGAEQLLKHALGLATQQGNGFSLYYLYYDWHGKESDKHKEEIKRFASRVGDELRFKALTYQEVHNRLKQSTPPDSEYPKYLAYLGKRYFPGRG